MKVDLKSILTLLFTLVLLLCVVACPSSILWAADSETPEEVKINWQIKANANRSWSSENARDDGTVYARYNGNDTFTLNLSGTATLTKTGTSYEGYPYYQPTTDNEYGRSCSGDGTYNTWYLNELQTWTPERGYVTKDFESTTVETWSYRWPGEEHEGAGDNPVGWLVILPPESENAPPRYRISLEPFFFITHDTADEYFETTGTIERNWENWEGSHSESEQLGDHAGHNAPGHAEQAWYDKMYNTPEGTIAEGDLNFAAGEYRGQTTVKHIFEADEGNSSIEITIEINRPAVAKEIQPNQVLGRYAYRDDSDYEPATDFVAGKDTVIQVFLPDDVKAEDQSDAKVEVYRDGGKIATLTSFKKDISNNALIFIPPSPSSCGNWQAGTYKFVATIGDSDEDLALENIKFQKQRELKVLAVPVTANYKGTIETPGTQWRNGGTFMRRVYPVATNDFTYQRRSLFNATSYDITTTDGQYELWKTLAFMQKKNGPYDQIIGFIEKRIPLPDGRMMQGYTYGAPVSIVVNSDQDMQATVAHEVAHAYEIGDEYKRGAYHLSLNVPPLGYQGTDWNDAKKTVTANDPNVLPYPGAEGVLISKKLYPYDTSGRGLLTDSLGFMGSGAAQAKTWITPSVWQHLFSSLSSLRSPAAVLPTRESQDVTDGIRMIEAYGWISSNGEVEITLPWPSYMTTEAFIMQSGTYTIQALSAAGEILASNGFTPASFVHSNPPQLLDPAPLTNVRVPFPEGTAGFIILDRNNTILAEYAVSPHAPTVDNISLAITSDQSLEGIQTITWEGADEDGDGLFYTIEYTPNGLDWVLLAFNLTSRQWTQDFDLLPGGETARIKVTASDGVNSSLPGVSSVFQVPTKGPEVYIEAPESGSSFSTAIGGVVLQGSAYDPQDGPVFDDNQLVWTSDRVDSAIGYGPSVYTDILGEGEHKITLTACNSYKQCSSQSVTVNINSLPPAIYTVTLKSNPSAGGSISGAGIYDAGVTVKLEAAPNEGYTFVNWTENDLEVSQEPCHSFVITANKNLTANFRLNDPITNTGPLSIDTNSYVGTSAKAVITVNDPVVNTDAAFAQSVTVEISSTSDSNGIPITLIETGPNTGIFQRDMGFSLFSSSSELRQILISDHDTFQVSYRDSTDSLFIEKAHWASVEVGDVNGDGDVNLADLILTLQSVSMFNNLNIKITRAADANGDEKIGLEEATYILRLIAE